MAGLRLPAMARDLAPELRQAAPRTWAMPRRSANTMRQGCPGGVWSGGDCIAVADGGCAAGPRAACTLGSPRPAIQDRWLTFRRSLSGRGRPPGRTAAGGCRELVAMALWQTSRAPDHPLGLKRSAPRGHGYTGKTPLHIIAGTVRRADGRLREVRANSPPPSCRERDST